MSNEELLKKAKEYGYCNLFACPETAADLQEYCERFNGSEKIIALTVMSMTDNFMSMMFAKQAAKEVEDAR